ncbi:hypothetical protein AURDEDRAFT_163113, partial [Auricularia subglabra TFB-10046 SS5]
PDFCQSDAAIVQNISFPSLKQAALSCRDRVTISNDALTALLRHIFVTVEDFTYGEKLEIALVEGLKALTSVKILRLKRFGNGAEAVLRELSRPDAHAAWLLPMLDELVLCDHKLRDSLRQEILEIARARGGCAPPATRPPHSLRSLVLKNFMDSSRQVNTLLMKEINNLLSSARAD